MTRERPTVYVAPGGGGSRHVGLAFAEGAAARVRDVSEGYAGGPVFTYGLLRGLGDVVAQCRAAGREWYYADNGYLAPGHWRGYFAVTRGAYRHSGVGVPRYDRLAHIGHPPIQARPATGRHVLICLQSPRFYPLVGAGEMSTWLARTQAELALHTDRPVRVRAKPDADGVRSTTNAAPFSADLADAWAVVTHSSNVGIEALCESRKGRGARSPASMQRLVESAVRNASSGPGPAPPYPRTSS